jgi:peptidoglycan hydrolase FlgJ
MTSPVTPSRPVASAPPVGAPAGDKAALGKAAEAFEAVILRQMLASARQAKLADDVFGSGASDNFREMADARLADSLAALKQFGIASLLEQQLGRNSGTAK